MKTRGRCDNRVDMRHLKTCPFCGADPEFVGEVGAELASDDKGAKAWITCQKCGGSISAFVGIGVIEELALKNAVAGWNSRAK